AGVIQRIRRAIPLRWTVPVGWTVRLRWTVLFGWTVRLRWTVPVGWAVPVGWTVRLGCAVRLGISRPGRGCRGRDAPRGLGVRGGDPGGIEETEGFQAVVGPAQHVHVQDAGAATQARQGVVEGVDVVALAVTRGGASAAGHRAD